MSLSVADFKHIWSIDFEFRQDRGEHPIVHCLVAVDLVTGVRIYAGPESLANSAFSPYDDGEESLVIAYYAIAEIRCYLSLSWRLPQNVIDIYVEFRNITNGKFGRNSSYSLLAALKYYGHDLLGAIVKKSMRDLAIRGGPFSDIELRALLNYCESDVDGLVKLFISMRPIFEPELDYALLRGEYVKAAAQIESNGIPIDVPMFDKIVRNKVALRERLIAKGDEFNLYQGTTFKIALFQNFLQENNYEWPTTNTGRPKSDTGTLKERSKRYPELAQLYQMNRSLSLLKSFNVKVSQDNRSRYSLSVFSSKTSRNQPREFIFSVARWLRYLIKPGPGRTLAYIDWGQQEFGIAAALSEDPLMMDAYLAGDPYLAFAKQAKAVPGNATKQSHRAERNKFKACVLAVQYGMGAERLAFNLGITKFEASKLLQLHRDTYKKFWAWIERVQDNADLKRFTETCFRWRLHMGDPKTTHRTVANFPMQANGAEMLRIACTGLIDAGVQVCAPVHDAVLIEVPSATATEDIKQAQDIMREASEIVLGGFALRTDVERVDYPNRYQPEGAKDMWDTVMGILDELE